MVTANKGKTIVSEKESCIKLSARTARKNAKSLLNPAADGPYTAKIAFQSASQAVYAKIDMVTGTETQVTRKRSIWTGPIAAKGESPLKRRGYLLNGARALEGTFRKSTNKKKEGSHGRE